MSRRGPVPDACVVIPARDEAQRIRACIEALAIQRGNHRIEVVLVLDGCTDATGPVAALVAARHGLALRIVSQPAAGPGAARRTGMELAARRLLRLGRADGLLATTDADTRVAPDWIARQLRHVANGAQAIAGWIELDPEEAAALPPGVVERRGQLARERLSRVRRREPHAEHHHFGGASIGVTAHTYATVGGIEPRPVLEDDAFAARLREHGVPIVRALDVRVVTSARTRGRADRGLAVDLSTLCELDRVA